MRKADPPLPLPPLDQLPAHEDYPPKPGHEYKVIRPGYDLAAHRKLGWTPVARYLSRNGDGNDLVTVERKNPSPTLKETA